MRRPRPGGAFVLLRRGFGRGRLGRRSRRLLPAVSAASGAPARALLLRRRVAVCGGLAVGGLAELRRRDVDCRGRRGFLGLAVLGRGLLRGLPVLGGCYGGRLLLAVSASARAASRSLLRLRRLLVGRLGLLFELLGDRLLGDRLRFCRLLGLRLLDLRLRRGLLDLLLARSTRRLLGLGLG